MEHCPGLLEHHDIQSEQKDQKDKGEQEGKEEHVRQETTSVIGGRWRRSLNLCDKVVIINCFLLTTFVRFKNPL